uniref:Stomatin n=1 Tax=Triatoma infestans TaxID=30076 RepID=A0A170YB07_TRIIF
MNNFYKIYMNLIKHIFVNRKFPSSVFFKLARAKVIAAEGEMKAARSLKEASDVIAESPAALQLRYLQTLNTISAEKNSTIVFPLPLDIIAPFLNKNK